MSDNPEKREMEGVEPRIGVYICDCGGNISDTVNCQKVAEALPRLPNVAVSRRCQFMCSDIGQKLITEDIRENGVNRVVVGACSIFLHEQTFRKTVQRAGLNPYFYYHIGLREQDSWVHHDCPLEATEKAVRMMSAGVAKASKMRPLESIRLDAEKHVLVIGGGVAGLRAALSIARGGLRVTLIEKSNSLGGHVMQWNRLFPTDEDARKVVNRLIADVMAEKKIEVMTETEVISSKGYVGNFEVRIRKQSTETDLKIGAIVIATGFEPYDPYQGELGYGIYPEVITLPKLESILSNHTDHELMWNNHAVRSVAMIHCVGSRQVEGVHKPQSDGKVNDYCSRVCCTATLAAANEIREKFPNVNVYDVYQDIRAYGRGHEDYYLRASKNRVTFLRYFAEEVPEVVHAEEGDQFPLLVKVKDHLTWGEEVQLPVDLVVLSVGMMPSPIQDLMSMFKVAPGSDRFLLEVHPKLRPVETAVPGVVLAGTAQAPMNVLESCAAAEAAASKVSILLCRGEVELEPYVARVDPNLCEGSGECVRLCPQEGAIHLETVNVAGKSTQRAVVTEANCNGCGVCVSACPNRAIDVQGWQLDEYEAMVQAIAADVPSLEDIA
ncbi:MAG TPA: CoB--CoM heterodisulfide reductase iron-sulfur subunit A family protein [Candidatus Acidoferrales bacterium]|nr:CoB--CoM heterodisulfide reductase iron-sulfur subunit A family protein [Candidatus Acidoferrales bacterium]